MPRQLDPLAPPVEQRRLELLLQVLDRDRERRLAHLERARRRREAPAMGDGVNVPKLRKLHERLTVIGESYGSHNPDGDTYTSNKHGVSSRRVQSG